MIIRILFGQKPLKRLTKMMRYVYGCTLFKSGHVLLVSAIYLLEKRIGYLFSVHRTADRSNIHPILATIYFLIKPFTSAQQSSRTLSSIILSLFLLREHVFMPDIIILSHSLEIFAGSEIPLHNEAYYNRESFGQFGILSWTWLFIFHSFTKCSFVTLLLYDTKLSSRLGNILFLFVLSVLV